MKKREKLKSARSIFDVLGIDTTGFSEADLLRGAEMASRVTRCGCGADQKRGAAIAAWREFIDHAKIAKRSDGKSRCPAIKVSDVNVSDQENA